MDNTVFIGEISYRVAYIKVGFLYRNDFISGRQQGSLLHWGIRLICYLVIWGLRGDNYYI